MKLLSGTISLLTGLSLVAAGSLAVAEEWPDLPVGIKSGVSARVGDNMFVGLGSAGTDFFALDLTNPSAGWVKKAAFPGPAPSGAAAAASGDTIYVFGGSGKVSEDAASPIIFDTVFSYDVAADAWSSVDAATPVGLLGATAIGLSNGKIAVTGGYNKELFDQYLSDVLGTDKTAEPEKWNKIVGDYMGMRPEDYRWNDNVLMFDPASNAWQDAGENPYLPNTGAAIVETGKDRFLLISGEIKPGLRTPKVKEITFSGDQAVWNEKAQIPVPIGDDLQEGLAGAYAGHSGDAILVAGGANFKGARARAISEQWFAHEGLAKRWNGEVYAMLEGGWLQVGNLPDGMAYGASTTTGGGVLIIGGEDSERKARSDVFLLRWDGGALTRID